MSNIATKSINPLLFLINKIYKINNNNTLPLYYDNKNTIKNVLVDCSDYNNLYNIFKNISSINLNIYNNINNNLYNTCDTQINSNHIEKEIFSISKKYVPALYKKDVFNNKNINIKALRHLINENNGCFKINSYELYQETLFNKNDIDIIKNYNEFIVYQPFGTQKFPDFLYVIYKDGSYIFQSIEVKSSYNGIAIWNNNYPKENTIYIFYDSKFDKATYFMGSYFINKYIKTLIYISEKSIDIFIGIINKIFEINNIMWKKVHYKKTEHTNTIRYVKDNKNEERMKIVEDYISKLY